MSIPVLKDNPDMCMKCGFCMSACPVYNIDHIEAHVARGRNMLVLMAENTNLDSEDSYKSALYYCLLCGRCETVCPAGVSNTAITLEAREKYTKKNGAYLGPS